MAVQYNPAIVTDGLVLCLDAANLKSYPGSGTNWFDLSGFGNTGVLSNGPTYSSSNQGLISFDGTDDFINCGTGLGLSSSWCIGAFVKFSNSSAAQVIIGRTGNASTSYIQNYVLYANASNKFGCQSSSNSYRGVQSTTTMITNNWYYVTGIYNSTSKVISIYVNGNFENDSTPLSVDPPTTSTQYVTLGAGDGTSANNRLTGNISFAHIYNRALTAAEVLQNFNALRGRFGI